MLTSDLAISWRRRDKLFPFLIKTEDERYRRDAASLIAIFADSIGRARGELERELEEFIGEGTDYRILRGLIKLLVDRCEFETAGVVDPAEIRQRIFLKARSRHPVLPGAPAREEILAEAAAELQTSAGSVLSNLYSDLPARQHLISFDPITPADLLDRYNLAQAQALLYKCVEMKIRVEPSDASNYRAIFGWIKHFGLIHSVVGNQVNGYEITLTGAASLFHRSQKYGIRMAVFLPALLLCTDWKMTAEIAQKDRHFFYELSSAQTELSSCYFEEPEYVNPDVQKLLKNWTSAPAGWKLEENRAVVDLGRTAFIPDLVLISPAGEKVFLDVLGFWTPKSLNRRLEEFRAADFRRFILAASQELRGSRDEPQWESENVLFYKTRIDPLRLVEMTAQLIG